MAALGAMYSSARRPAERRSNLQNAEAPPRPKEQLLETAPQTQPGDYELHTTLLGSNVKTEADLVEVLAAAANSGISYRLAGYANIKRALDEKGKYPGGLKTWLIDAVKTELEQELSERDRSNDDYIVQLMDNAYKTLMTNTKSGRREAPTWILVVDREYTKANSRLQHFKAVLERLEWKHNNDASGLRLYTNGRINLWFRSNRRLSAGRHELFGAKSFCATWDGMPLNWSFVLKQEGTSDRPNESWRLVIHHRNYARTLEKLDQMKRWKRTADGATYTRYLNQEQSTRTGGAMWNEFSIETVGYAPDRLGQDLGIPDPGSRLSSASTSTTSVVSPYNPAVRGFPIAPRPPPSASSASTHTLNLVQQRQKMTHPYTQGSGGARAPPSNLPAQMSNLSLQHTAVGQTPAPNGPPSNPPLNAHQANPYMAPQMSQPSAPNPYGAYVNPYGAPPTNNPQYPQQSPTNTPAPPPPQFQNAQGQYQPQPSGTAPRQPTQSPFQQQTPNNGTPYGVPQQPQSPARGPQVPAPAPSQSPYAAMQHNPPPPSASPYGQQNNPPPPSASPYTAPRSASPYVQQQPVQQNPTPSPAAVGTPPQNFQPPYGAPSSTSSRTATPNFYPAMNANHPNGFQNYGGGSPVSQSPLPYGAAPGSFSPGVHPTSSPAPPPSQHPTPQPGSPYRQTAAPGTSSPAPQQLPTSYNPAFGATQSPAPPPSQHPTPQPGSPYQQAAAPGTSSPAPPPSQHPAPQPGSPYRQAAAPGTSSPGPQNLPMHQPTPQQTISAGPPPASPYVRYQTAPPPTVPSPMSSIAGSPKPPAGSPAPPPAGSPVPASPDPNANYAAEWKAYNDFMAQQQQQGAAANGQTYAEQNVNDPYSNAYGPAQWSTEDQPGSGTPVNPGQEQQNYWAQQYTPQFSGQPAGVYVPGQYDQNAYNRDMSTPDSTTQEGFVKDLADMQQRHSNPPSQQTNVPLQSGSPAPPSNLPTRL